MTFEYAPLKYGVFVQEEKRLTVVLLQVNLFSESEWNGQG